jgi:hypothetical protein
MQARQAHLISPHTRAAIVKKVGENKPWKGTRLGVRIEIQHARQLNFTKNRIQWRARINHQWFDGHAETIWNAVQEIETQAAKMKAAVN